MIHNIKYLLSFVFIFSLMQNLCAQCPHDPTITVSPPDPDGIYCPGDIVTLTTQVYDSYQWFYNFSNSNTGGTPVTGGTTQSIDLGASEWAVTYFYVEATLHGCTEASPTVVWDSWVFLAPSISGPPGGSYCSNETIEIMVAFPGPTFFQWYQNGVPIPGATNVNYFVTQSGTYTVEVAYPDCPDYWLSSGTGPTYTIESTMAPTVSFNNGVLMSSSSSAYQWNLDGAPINGATEQTYIPSEEGSYTVTVGQSGCTATSSAIQVNASDIDFDMDGYSLLDDCDDTNPDINPGEDEIPNNDVDEDCDGVALVIDEDGDGFNSDDDCNDDDPNINPGETEIPNNDVDEDCDGTALIIDEDGDGYNSDDDCDDGDPNVNPGEEEIANNYIDEDCDGVALFIDLDNDGFHSDEDCNDSNPNINPGEEEIPNNDVDEDCDGIALIIDNDGDGYNSDDDCNDNDPNINPGEDEIPNNDVDENCDGFLGEVDQDGDGFLSNVDCNDEDPNINPDAEEIPNNNVDENCDGEILIIDEDGDGFNSDDDCDDADPNINPDASEIANNDVDENCDGELLIIDEDGDGFNSDDDCDDADPNINPDEEEIANNDIDENCDGEILVIDEDGDGFNSDEDCDDNDPNINPDADEIANNDVDENCDGTLLIIDEDGDGFNSDEDCDDTNDQIYPGAIEIPDNGIDEDCDGEDAIASSVLVVEKTMVKVYPNPASEFIRIDLEEALNREMIIYNVQGKKVKSMLLNSSTNLINVSDLTPGLFYLIIEEDEIVANFIKL